MTGATADRPTERRELFVLTGATAFRDDSGVFLIPNELRRVEKLSNEFDIRLGLKRVTSRGPHSCAVPNRIKPAWYPLYRSRLQLLNPFYYRDLLRHMQEADAVLVIMPVLEGIPCLLLARLLRTPSYLMLVSRATGFRVYGGEKNLYRRIQTSILMNLAGIFAHRVMADGKQLAREFWFPVRRRVRVVLFSTLTEEDFAPIPSEPPGQVELLTVCRLVGTKRVDVAIRSLPLLARKGIRAELSIAGDGPERANLQHLAEQLSVGHLVRFHGYLDPDELRTRYRSAFAFVLPSELEGLNLAIMEAMAAGRPVLATAAGEQAEFLRDGVDSLIISSDPADVATKIETLVRDPELYMSIARNAQQKIRSLNPDEWLHQLHQLVREDLSHARSS